MLKARLAISVLMLLSFVAAQCQSCTTANGFQCTQTLNLNLPPQHYTPYNVPVNENFQILDQFAGTTNTQIANIFGNTPTIAVTQGSYPDLGAALNAADTANAGKAVIFQFPTTGTLATPWHLSQGHFLQVYAPIQEAAQGTVNSQSGIDCISYNSPITSTLPIGSDMIVLPPGTSQTGFARCRVESSYNTFLYSPQNTQDISLERNYAHNTELYQQQSASASAPTLRFISLYNTITLDTPSPGIIGEVLYGATQDFLTEGDTCTNTAHCHEFYSIDGGGFPSYAAIAATGLNNGRISHTVCRNVYYACDWTSGADYITIDGGQANQCGDVCFDHEAAGHVFTTNFSCRSDGAGCATLFFVSTSSIISNGRCSGLAPCIGLHNAQQVNLGNLTGTLVDGITADCGPSTSTCTFLSLDSNTGTTVENSQVTNGTVTSPGYSSGLNLNGDTFTYTVAGAGLQIPNLRNGALNVFKNLTVQFLGTSESAGTAAISATNIDFNFQNTYIFDDIHTLGFPVDALVANNGGNVPAIFTFRNSTLGAGNVVTGQSNAGVSLVCTNDYSLTGTTPLPTGCH